jgi:small conductance mechanosensitive channel
MIGGVFYCLYLFGLNTASLLTSAGILSIVIGLGAQSLISDIIAGIFIVFEGEFRVGDIVTIGDFRGQVVEIGLRTTKIVDISNNIKIFNNASISGVLNMTKESSYASVDVGIEYGESLERVENVLSEAFPEIKKKLPSIIDGPFYKGVVELGSSSVNIRILATCKEQDRIQLSRDLNREIFLLFNRNNINIPFPQVTLSHLKENNNELTNKEKIAAEAFVNEQKEAARNADIDDDDD